MKSKNVYEHIDLFQVKSFWKLLFEMIVYLDTGQINNTGTADFTDGMIKTLNY